MSDANSNLRSHRLRLREAINCFCTVLFVGPPIGGIVYMLGLLIIEPGNFEFNRESFQLTFKTFFLAVYEIYMDLMIAALFSYLVAFVPAIGFSFVAALYTYFKGNPPVKFVTLLAGAPFFLIVIYSVVRQQFLQNMPLVSFHNTFALQVLMMVASLISAWVCWKAIKFKLFDFVGLKSMHLFKNGS